MSRKSAVLGAALIAATLAAAPSARAGYLYSVSGPSSINSDSNQFSIQINPESQGGPITDGTAGLATLATFRTVAGFTGSDSFTNKSADFTLKIFQAGSAAIATTTFGLSFSGDLNVPSGSTGVTNHIKMLLDSGTTSEDKIVTVNGTQLKLHLSVPDGGPPFLGDPANATKPQSFGTQPISVNVIFPNLNTGATTSSGTTSSGTTSSGTTSSGTTSSGTTSSGTTSSGTTSSGTTSSGTTSSGTTSSGTTSSGTTSAGGTGTNPAPEPSTMVLSCVGVVLLGASRCRRWLRGRKATA
jgi:mucin-2